MQTVEILQAALSAKGTAKDLLLKAAKTQDIKERIRACTSCDLHKSVRAPVPFEGTGSVAIIGEAPGRDEDAQGRPFVGRAGRLLTECLEQAGFTREGVSFVNTICCRPPNNNFEEAEKVHAPQSCKPNFLEQLAASGAWLLVPVGNTAMWQLLPQLGAGITQHRGGYWWVGKYLIMPTFHPAYALRNPSAREKIVEDLLRVRRVLQGVERAPVPKNFDPTILLEELREEALAVEHYAGIAAKTLDNPRSRTESQSFKGHFKKHGWVFAYSKWLEDHIILVRDKHVVVPSHIVGVIYTVKELAQVAAMDRTLGDVHRLHYAKKELDAVLI